MCLTWNNTGCRNEGWDDDRPRVANGAKTSNYCLKGNFTWSTQRWSRYSLTVSWMLKVTRGPGEATSRKSGKSSTSPILELETVKVVRRLRHDRRNPTPMPQCRFPVGTLITDRSWLPPLVCIISSSNFFLHAFHAPVAEILQRADSLIIITHSFRDETSA